METVALAVPNQLLVMSESDLNGIKILEVFFPGLNIYALQTPYDYPP